MNPYPASRRSAVQLAPTSDPAGTSAATTRPTPNAAAAPATTSVVQPRPSVDPAGTAARTVTVTPENAAQYGFDRIGSTINLDTGGIVNPFSGPADGQGANRAARNTEVQNRAIATPNPIGHGYTEIMSDPAARRFNDQLANDPRYAWNVLNFERSNPGHSEVYGGNFTPTGNVTPQPTPTGPYANTGIGTRSAPAGGTPSNGTNPYPAGSPNAATWDYYARGGANAGTSNDNLAAPASSGTPTTPTTPTNPDTGGGYTGGTVANSYSSGGYRAPTAPAPGTASGNVTNAIMRRFNRRNW